MININKLFIKRLTSEWKYNLGVWKSVIDWTVALYIVIPALAFAIYQYRLWWYNPPKVLAMLPITIFIAISAFFAWQGTIRIFVKEADQLFLLKRTKWVPGIIGRGISYSIFLNLILSLFFFSLMAPLLIKHYEISISDFIAFFLITFLIKVLSGLLKQRISLFVQGIKQYLALKGLFVLLSSIFVIILPHIFNSSVLFFLIVLILLICNYVLIQNRIKLEGTFLADVEREQKESLKYVSFLLSFAGVRVENKKSQRSRPWLFRKSNHIFKKRTTINGLVELCIKATLRNKGHVTQYMELVILSILTVLALPTLKWLIWLGIAFILTNFVGLFWKEFMVSEYTKIFQWKKEHKYLALRKFLFIMTLPGFLLVSTALGLQTFSWIGILVIIPLSVGLVHYMSKLVSLYI